MRNRDRNGNWKDKVGREQYTVGKVRGKREVRDFSVRRKWRK